MAYTVLARRYRSLVFDDVLGQDAVAQTLKNAITSGRVAHAYLFSGTRGVGKTTMARILAKSLNCLNADGPTVTPCLKCDSCLSVNLGEDIDVIEIDGASNTGVDNIRQLRENAIYKPARARFKVYIIDEVHMLSTGAFNALLKILEEPPEHIKFIFATTEPNKILPTIQSRCQRFDFRNISPTVIGEQLKKVLKKEKVKYEDDVIVKLSRLANGSMRDALSLLDQLISAGNEKLTLSLVDEFLGEPGSETVYELLEQIANSDAARVLEAINTLLISGRTAVQIVDALITSLRDLMVVKSSPGKRDSVILTEQEYSRALQIAEHFDIPAMIYAITALEKLQWTIKNSDNPRALLEATMLRFTLSEHFIAAGEILSQLQSKGGVTNRTAKPSVKKKSIEPNRSTRACDNTQKNEPPSLPTLKVEPSLESIVDNWPDILNAVKSQNTGTGGFLSSAKPSDFKNGVLRLAFPKAMEMAMRMCENRKEQVKKLLSTVVGHSIHVQFELVKAGNGPSGSGSLKAAGAKMNSKKRQEILDKPEVKLMLTELKASPLRVEEVNRHE